MEGSTPPGEQPIPEAAPPTPIEPKTVTRSVRCGACGTTFDFPMKETVEKFKFNCTKCSALNDVAIDR